MIEKDTFDTIALASIATYTEKRSKFIAYAIPISCVEDIKPEIDKLRKQYYDARHVCWAYMLGAARTDFRANDDGEPSGTAGKPILGQINSNGLTDILIVVIRYFGGIKLGTGGLIVAYREAAALAIAQAEVIEKTIDCSVSFSFGYLEMNDVMKIVKDLEPVVVMQNFDTDCTMVLRIRKAQCDQLISRLRKLDTIKINGE